MALVLVCGQPCSGKSTAAECLRRALEAQHPSSCCNVRIIDEPSLHLDRNQSYADMPSEKNLRGVLRSEVDRSVSKDSIIIVDSLNSIKLYCDAEESYCKAWNIARQEQGEPAYSDKIVDDLVRRFEKPERRNRWDSPLFELKPAEEQIQESSSAILEAVSFLTRKIDSKSRDVHILQPTIATQNVRTSDTNSLYELDRATQDVMNALIDSQAQGYGGLVNSTVLGEGLPNINIRRAVGLPELRRLRRTFVKLTGQSSLSGPPPPIDAQSAKRMFVDYLNRELGAT